MCLKQHNKLAVNLNGLKRYLLSHSFCGQESGYDLAASSDSRSLTRLKSRRWPGLLSSQGLNGEEFISTILDRSGENRQLCILSDLRGKDFSLFLLSVMIAVGLFVDFLYQLEVCLNILES